MDDFSNSTGFSDASSSDLPMSAAELNALLQEGLDALKQYDYERAIAHLSQVRSASSDRALQLKAKIGLVKAYASEGNTQLAIALCKSLAQDRNPRVQQWAAQLLQDLDRYDAVLTDVPDEASSADADASPSTVNDRDSTGFVPLTEAGTPPSPAVEPAIAPDESGFVPLTTTSPAAEAASLSSHDDETGFTPIQPPSQTDQPLSDNPFVLPPHAAIAEPGSETNPVTKIQSSTKARSTAQPKTRIQTNTRIQTSKAVKSSTLPSAPMQADAVIQESVVSPNAAAPPDSEVKSFPVWRQAGRAQKWVALGKVDVSTLWAVLALTAIALVGVCWLFAKAFIFVVNHLKQWLSWLPLVEPDQFYGNPLWFVVLVLVMLFGLSPWLLDRILRSNYGAKSLTLDMLSRYSPEATRMLKRVCSQKGYFLPTLSILYTTAPVILTYGNLRRNARIAVSQGLLDQLADDEIAALYAAEMGHLKYWDFGVLSWVTLVTQIPYWVYWKVAAWGDRQRDRALQSIAIGLSSLCYGIYWCLRWVGLWLSRLRLCYSDRAGCEITGNPNGFTRALLKLAIGIARDIQRQGQTAALLESFDLLMPVSYRSALTLGSVCLQSPLEPLLAWDWQNPYRRWLAINNSHLPLGDRLQTLMTYARHWRVEPELDLPQRSRTIPKTLRRRKDFLLQIAPFMGVPIGLALAYGLWIFGAIADHTPLLNLDWMWKDPSLLRGCILIGFSIGMFLRINPFFPDITRANTQSEPELPDLLADPAALPLDSQPIRLQGKLIGNRGFANMLSQDLILKSNTGLIKLHFTSPLGVFGNLIPQSPRPQDFINNTVLVTGWFRRGATSWIDVDRIQIERGKPVKSSHPLWATFISTLAALWGLYIITKGGF